MMAEIGILEGMSQGFMLLCVSVAGIAAVLIWLIAGLATGKKREAKILRKAMAGSASFRSTDFTDRGAAAAGREAESAFGKADGDLARDAAWVAETELMSAETELMSAETEPIPAETELMSAEAEPIPDETEAISVETGKVKYCGSCGEKLRYEDRFCLRCGAGV